jgi:hypothetical protein
MPSALAFGRAAARVVAVRTRVARAAVSQWLAVAAGRAAVHRAVPRDGPEPLAQVGSRQEAAERWRAARAVAVSGRLAPAASRAAARHDADRAVPRDGPEPPAQGEPQVRSRRAAAERWRVAQATVVAARPALAVDRAAARRGADHAVLRGVPVPPAEGEPRVRLRRVAAEAVRPAPALPALVLLAASAPGGQPAEPALSALLPRSAAALWAEGLADACREVALSCPFRFPARGRAPAQSRTSRRARRRGRRAPAHRSLTTRCSSAVTRRSSGCAES